MRPFFKIESVTSQIMSEIERYAVQLSFWLKESINISKNKMYDDINSGNIKYLKRKLRKCFDSEKCNQIYERANELVLASYNMVEYLGEPVECYVCDSIITHVPDCMSYPLMWDTFNLQFERVRLYVCFQCDISIE